MDMQKVERVLNALAFKAVDRVPVVPLIIQHAIELSGNKHGAYSTRPDVMAETVMACQRHYDFDSVYISTDNYVLCEAFGAKVNFPEDQPPQLLCHPLKKDDISLLPKFTLEKGRMHVILKATALCRKQLKDSVFIKTNIDSAPFSAAAAIRGPEQFLMDLYENETFAQALLEVATEAVVAYGKAAAQAGAHGLAFGDSVSGLMSREMYAKFALPYAQAAISRLKETGLPVFYHVCGNTNHMVDLMAQSGADCIEIDSVTNMQKAADICRNQCAIEGNIATVETLLNGTPEEVTREANAIISLFGNKGGLLLSSACEIPRFSPEANIAAMVTASKAYPYGNA